MQVIFHIGIQCTDEDRLLKCMLRNAGDWRHEGIAVPGPSKYRRLLSDAVNELAAGRATPDAQDVVLDAILTEDPGDVNRLVLSHPNFLSVPRLAMKDGILFRRAERRLGILRDLMSGHDLKIFVGLRDFATWLPMIDAGVPQHSFAELLYGSDPQDLRWSDLIRRLRFDLPEVPIVAWANEDTPLIWGMILRALAGLPEDRKLIGAFDMMAQIIDPEGMRRFRVFLRDNPDLPEPKKRQVMAAFMERYALPEAMEQELDLPGWDEAYIAEMSARYEDDLEIIADMEGVTFLSP